MKLSKFNKKLKQEFEDTINPIEIKEEKKNKSFKFHFKFRYAFMAVFTVLILFLVINHISVTIYNNNLTQEIDRTDYENLRLNVSKYDSKEKLEEALVYTPKAPVKKMSVLQGIFSLFRGCSSSNMSASSGAPSPHTPVDVSNDTAIDPNGETENGNGSSYNTNVVEKGIDEADVAKFDGTYIYSLYTNKLYIYDLKGNVIFEKVFNYSLTNMYLYNDKIVLFSKSLLEIYTYKDNDLILEKSYEGFITQSRLFNNNLYIIVSDYLDLDSINYDNCYYDSSVNPNCIYHIYKINLDNLEETLGDLVSSYDNNLYMSDNYIYFSCYNYYGGLTNFFIIDLDLNGYAVFKESGYALDKYCFSEYEGYFRFVLRNNKEKIRNSIYVYDVKNKKMAGSLENQIGLEYEQVKSVKFRKNKCYICTYRNTDPLYVIDLSDYNNINILYELHVPGYSSYLHYFEMNGVSYVLGVGYNDNRLPKITIYKEENDELTQVGKSLVLANFDTDDFIEFDEAYYKLKTKDDNYAYNRDALNQNVIGYFFYIDSNYLYFGSPTSDSTYTMFKIDVTNNENPISVHYEYKTDMLTTTYRFYENGYQTFSYLRCFLINYKYYYFGDGRITIEDF